MKYAVALAVLLSATAQLSLAQAPSENAVKAGSSAAVAALTGHQPGTQAVLMDSVSEQDAMILEQGDTAVCAVSGKLETLLEQRLSEDSEVWGPSTGLLVSVN